MISPKNRRYPSRYSEPSPSCKRWVLATSQVAVATRLDVYAEGYFIRLRDALENVYPLTRKVLGDGFSERVIDYLKKRPSTYWSVSDLGNAFARSVRPADPTYLSDLARFEWISHLCFYVPTVTTPRSVVAQPESLVRLHAGIRLFESHWNIPAFAERSEFVLQKKHLRRWVLYRRGGTIQVQPVPEFFHPVRTRRWHTLSNFCRLTFRGGTAKPVEISQFFKLWTSLGLLQLRCK